MTLTNTTEMEWQLVAATRIPRTVNQLPRILRADAWMTALCFVLAGYAVFGKSFAYLGIPPLFVGEILLFWGVLVLIFDSRWRELLELPVTWLLLLFMVWSWLQTLPYLKSYGLNALRDAMLWGYGSYSIIILGVLLARPNRLNILIARYRILAPILLLGAPVLWLAGQVFEDSIPSLPWANVRVLDLKGGDVLVHLAALLAFWVSGLARRISLWQGLSMACAVGLVGMHSRGGLLAFLIVFALCLAHRRTDRSLWSAIAAAFIVIMLLAFTGLRVPIPGKQRELSSEQMLANISSMVSDSEQNDLEGKKQWRLNWWSDIVNYTVFGKHFWNGKGYGINLADDDGYQGTAWEGQLRSPHNGHLTVLARSGVPGFALWILLNVGWAHLMIRSYCSSRRANRDRWAGLFFFLICYWVAVCTRASFDVYLEGPMGGIWLWILFGIGLATVSIYRVAPGVLHLKRTPR